MAVPPLPFHATRDAEPTSPPHASVAAGKSPLRRLGRAWATTTPTAGAPHPAFSDNPARFAPLYSSRAPDASPGRPPSAGAAGPQRILAPRARQHPLPRAPSPGEIEEMLLPPSALAPRRPRPRPQSATTAGRGGAAAPPPPAGAYRRPSAVLSETYHEAKQAVPAGTRGAASPPRAAPAWGLDPAPAGVRVAAGGGGAARAAAGDGRKAQPPVPARRSSSTSSGTTATTLSYRGGAPSL